MKSNYIALTVFAALIALASCKKDNDNNGPGKVTVELNNVAGAQELSLHTGWYKNEHGDSFTVSKFNYYLSNIKLNGNSGNSYAEPESYHLVEEGDAASLEFNLTNIPAGQYNSITFTIGVDSLRNVSGVQTGALDPAKGNFWDWNSGYIMLKFEGNSPKAPTPDGALVFHSGGFSGPNSVLKTVTLTFPETVTVNDGVTPHIEMEADILKLFKSPNVIDFSAMTTIHMPGTNAKKLADNYAGMFTITHAGTH